MRGVEIGNEDRGYQTSIVAGRIQNAETIVALKKCLIKEASNAMVIYRCLFAGPQKVWRRQRNV